MEMLTSPEGMARFFWTRAPSLFPEGWSLKKCTPQVLRKRLASRQVVAYRLALSDEQGRSETRLVIAKGFSDPLKGMREYENMKMLWESGFDYTSNLNIPRPLAYVADFSILIQERAQGMTLRKNLGLSGPEALQSMIGAARWLQKLHGLNEGIEEASLYPNDDLSLDDFIRRTGKNQPQVASHMRTLVAQIRERLSSFKAVPLTLVHGDFQCENIFVNEKSVTVIDFGRFSRSDPARDLGYMVAQLRTMSFLDAVLLPSLLPGLKALWREYLQGVRRENGEDFSARTSVYAAIKCIENLCYISSFLPTGRGEILSFLLDDAKLFGNAANLEEALQF